MRKPILIIATGFLLLEAASAQQPAAAEADLIARKINGNVYLLAGGFTNTTASIGADGIVLIDPRGLPVADKIKAALASVSSQPIRFVINTHLHGDHTDGNAEFLKVAPVIAHRNARTRLEDSKDRSPGEASPTITFDNEIFLHMNGEDVRVFKVPTGHTDGDVMVYFPKSNVVNVGDDLMPPYLPFVDRRSGGSLTGLIGALEFAIARLPKDVKVIPGHGAVSSLANMQDVVTILKAMADTVAQGIRQGKSLDQLKNENVLDAWKSAVGDRRPVNRYLEVFYAEFTSK